MLILEIIPILYILHSCHEYHCVTSQAYHVNPNKNTELNSQSQKKDTWKRNTEGFETYMENKHKRNEFRRNSSSFNSSKDQSLSRIDANLKLVTTEEYFKNTSDSSISQPNTNNNRKHLWPSRKRNRTSMPVYVITGVRVSETVRPLSKVQHIRKIRYIFNTANSSIDNSQENTTANDLVPISEYPNLREGKKFANSSRNVEIPPKMSSTNGMELYKETESKRHVDKSHGLRSASNTPGYKNMNSMNQNKVLPRYSSDGFSTAENQNGIFLVE